MRRYLLDTGVASDYVNRRSGVYEKAREAVARGDRIGIATPVLGELWAGIYGSVSRQANDQRLRRQLSDFAIWPYDARAAEEFGRLSATLKRMGRPMQQADVQIAATALSLGHCTVATKDSDFAAVPGLDIVDWSTGP
jgi:tRNA(fMet)-specific endonuclease VapC